MHARIGAGMLGHAAVQSFFSASPEPGDMLAIFVTTAPQSPSAGFDSAAGSALSPLQATRSKTETQANARMKLFAAMVVLSQNESAASRYDRGEVASSARRLAHRTFRVR